MVNDDEKILETLPVLRIHLDLDSDEFSSVTEISIVRNGNMAIFQVDEIMDLAKNGLSFESLGTK